MLRYIVEWHKIIPMGGEEGMPSACRFVQTTPVVAQTPEEAEEKVRRLCPDWTDACEIVHVEIPSARRARIEGAIAAERAERIAVKGHDCEEHSEHGYDPDSRLGDYYYCGVCNDVLQVG